jgi:bifunctional DNA-binding transcriptional regulator/antitoxin component of YhaV-PrlF toxin-antitoxin module
MQTAHLTHAGHLILPAEILEACHLNAGQELEIEITAQGILLKALTHIKQPNTSAIDTFRGKGKGGAVSRLLADRKHEA